MSCAGAYLSQCGALAYNVLQLRSVLAGNNVPRSQECSERAERSEQCSEHFWTCWPSLSLPQAKMTTRDLTSPVAALQLAAGAFCSVKMASQDFTSPVADLQLAAGAFFR